MLPRAVTGSILAQVITWTDESGSIINLTGLTITGTIQPADSPAEIRAIVGSLTVTGGTNGKFTWHYDAADTEAPGLYLAQFKAVGGTDVLHSFASYWLVEPAGGIHPYSLAGLRIWLMEQLAPYRGTPNAYQYTQALLDAITAVGWRVPLKRTTLLNVVSGTDTYNLPADFLFEINLESAWGPDGVGYSNSGKLMVSSGDFCETHYVNGKTISFVPTPAYSAERRLWYAAGYVAGDDGVYQFMTEDIARLVLLKAEAGLLNLQARETSSKSGVSYQLGDVKVDKKGKAEAFTKLATEKAMQYESAVKARLGQQGMTA